MKLLACVWIMGVVSLYNTENVSNGVNAGCVKFSGARSPVLSTCGHVSTTTVT